MVFVKPSSKASMMGGNVWFVIFQVVLLFSGRCLGAVELFPFGSANGFNVGPMDDERFPLNFPFTVLVAGHEVSSANVSSNGFIEFVGRGYTFGSFSSNNVALLGYAADVTTATGGDIWMEAFSKTQDLIQLESDIHLVDTEFNATYAGVVTWDSVHLFDEYDYYYYDTLENSFQIIVVWDDARRKMFGILNYNKLEWVGYPHAGFNTGNTNTSFILGEPFSPAKRRDFLLSESNVGIPGKFVMRLDGEDTCIEFFYPQMSIDGGPWIPDKATKLTFERYQRVELKCQNDPDEWDWSLKDLEIQCDNGRVGSFDVVTKLATLTVVLHNAKEWIGVTCRCQKVPPSCTSSVTVDALLDAPTMKSFSIHNQTTEVVTFDSDSDVTRVGFQCVAEGNPTPHIAIMGLHTGLVIANQSAPDYTLRVDTDVACSVRDQYVCVAENSYGTSNRSSTILLRVPCMESVEDVETVQVSDDSVVDVAFKVKVLHAPTSFSLSKVSGGRTHYVNELLYDPSYYVVRYTKTDDVMGLGTVQLKLIDFDLMDMNVYRFTMTNGMGESLEFYFNSTRGTPAQVYTSHGDSSQANLIVVAVIVCVLVCVCVVFPVAYWCYATTQGIKPMSMIPEKIMRKMKKNNHHSPSSFYTLQGQTHANANMWRMGRY